MPNHQTIIKGKIGEFYTQMQLAKLGIDSISIDKTYDLFLWERGHRVEVKTSTLRKPKKGTNGYYEWQFYPYQYKREAFDYAVCIGLDKALNVDVVYIIPHKALENQTSLNINKTYINGSKSSYSTNYDNYSICRDNWNVFTTNSKRYFTRVKNQLTKRILNHNSNKLDDLKKVFKKVYNNPNIKKHNKITYLSNKCGISRTTVRRYIILWKLKGSKK